MTTQYGFFIDSSRCTGCKTCELACKDYKDLTPEVSFRRIYEYAGGDWQEDNGVWHQNVFAYYLSISCNHCEDPACTRKPLLIIDFPKKISIFTRISPTDQRTNKCKKA